MVTIHKDNHTLTVSSGAYREIYKPQGWALVSDALNASEPSAEPTVGKPSEGTKPEATEPLSDGGEEEIRGAETEGEGDPEDSDDPEEGDGAEDKDETRFEKPLSEMNFEELKEYAAFLHVDIEGMRSKKEIRSAIKAVQ